MSGSGSGNLETGSFEGIGKTIIKEDFLPPSAPENSILLTTLMVLFTAVTFGLFVTICYVCFKHNWMSHVRSRMGRLYASSGNLNLNGRFSLNRHRDNIEMTSSRMPLEIP